MDTSSSGAAQALEELIARLGSPGPEATGGGSDGGAVAALQGGLARVLLEDAAPEFLLEHHPDQLAGDVRAIWELARRRRRGEILVRVSARVERGHASRLTVDAVTDDMPFLVDSITMEVERHGLGVADIVHPVVEVERDGDGELVGVGIPRPGAAPERLESFVHLETLRRGEEGEPDRLRDDLERVLRDVHCAVADYEPMRAKALELAEELERGALGAETGGVTLVRGDAATEERAGRDVARTEGDGGGLEERREAAALLRWMAEGHFVFLGYREYDLVVDEDRTSLAPRLETGLGLLAGASAPRSARVLAPPLDGLAREPTPLVLTKANARATVHRAAQLDYVGVKRLDVNGVPVGERRFVGLYTSLAYNAGAREVPVVRRKVAAVLERVGLTPESHSEKALVAILDTLPRDELFQAEQDWLFETAVAILHLEQHQRVRLFCRPDRYGRYVSFLVYVPRERYEAQVLERVEALLGGALGAPVEAAVRIGESRLAQLHLVVRSAPPGPEELLALEAAVAELARGWEDALRSALAEVLGEEAAPGALEQFGDAFPPGFRIERGAWEASRVVAWAQSEQEMHVGLVGTVEDRYRLELWVRGAPLSLSRVVPVVEDLGATVLEEHPYEIRPKDAAPVFVDELTLSFGQGLAEDPGVLAEIQTSIRAVLQERTESDRLQRLVALSGLSWRQVSLLRAFLRYLRQVGTPFSDASLAGMLAANPEVVVGLVELFTVRLDGSEAAVARRGVPGGKARVTREDEVVAAIEEAIDRVDSLDADRLLRMLLGLVRAVLRTNFFADDGDDVISLKFDGAAVPGLPEPRPFVEIFVHARDFEGIHLRGGPVARGGLRHSDRRDDYRTEVLGLFKAQMVKNAVIVPVGAKGGFVVKPAAFTTASGEEAVRRCYRRFVSALLRLTDDRRGGALRRPAGVVCRDDPDPYLVVAADKGTATFSDLANEVSLSLGYWLGDAFASGGSSGYDHKAMGITARGAWESVRGHFRELGIDADAAVLRTVGIGDMSGDVFGNGMLCSQRIALVGAFDHRHVFLDPQPDLERSYAERLRLAGLARSSWGDYDPRTLGPGGGIFPRSAKAIVLTDEVRELLGVEAATLTPEETIRALLSAPVDLLWNGGVGTYVKASSERHADVGDRANDRLRVDGSELRCRVVAEGGNLGLTQRGRIEFARRGGRVNTDAIDNSAGVDCSDHEVNIKILLAGAITSGALEPGARDGLLEEMTEDVARHVLAHNRRQVWALTLASAHAGEAVGAHRRLVAELERQGRLDREVEALPGEKELAARVASGEGFARPELAVLLAYAKIALFEELVASAVPDSPALASELERYFPAPLPERFPGELDEHPLRRQIIATRLANLVVDHGGLTFVNRLVRDTGCHPAAVAAAYVVADRVLGFEELVDAFESAGVGVPLETLITETLGARHVMEGAVRWVLRLSGGQVDIPRMVERYRRGADVVGPALLELLTPEQRRAIEARSEALRSLGLAEPVARASARLQRAGAIFDAVEVAHEQGCNALAAMATYHVLGSLVGIDWLRAALQRLPDEQLADHRAKLALSDEVDRCQRDLTAQVCATLEPAAGAGGESGARSGDGERAPGSGGERAPGSRGDGARGDSVERDPSRGDGGTRASVDVAAAAVGATHRLAGERAAGIERLGRLRDDIGSATPRLADVVAAVGALRSVVTGARAG